MVPGPLGDFVSFVQSAVDFISSAISGDKKGMAIAAVGMGVGAVTGGEGKALLKAGESKVAKAVKVSESKYPETAAHIKDAQAAGQPSILTIDRGGADANRSAALAGHEPASPGNQLDEYPPAMFREGGSGASVREVGAGDNMGAGACIGNQCRGLPDGSTVQIQVTP